MESIRKLLLCAALLLPSVNALADVIDEKLQQYRSEGVTEFDATAGATLWQTDFDGRSCTSCHGNNPSEVGKHVKTGKRIEPMAPSVNSQRFNKSSKIDKWFLRNCKWTLNRTCTAQEKGDFLVWIREQ